MSDKLPRVTAILRIMEDAYGDVPSDALQRAADRGTALHGICCQHLAAMMDLCQLPTIENPDYERHYAGFLEWVTKRSITPYLVEQLSVNEEEGYIGTPDALVQYGTGELVVVDMKFTASIIRLNRVQIQAYHKLAGYTRAQKLILLHINPTSGEWEEIEVKPNPRDWCAFKCAISINQWRIAA